MKLRGYRSSHRPLLTGTWLPGELLGLPLADWPALADPTTVPPPGEDTGELCVVPDTGFVRYHAIDWVHRRARLEIGLRPDAVHAAAPLLTAAVEHGLSVLNLRRLYGWVTPATQPPTDALTDAGFRTEASVPGAIWLDGRPAERHIWGVTRND
ncbi:GNAT family N-acetyltransferase [Streptomyces sp. TBY4]|uniref:GNAT family N-acetyltransferase n=1 Tax=Streptomyces sp. TBY4 TaxID=2962030 RepID=UPI0020B68074|nr:hypothetical protein [Streptomyces sp. TBY4]MCP3760525.1 hypothetical protein [Streptomyces sp. TBY4]